MLQQSRERQYWMNPLAIVFLAAGLGLLTEGGHVRNSPWSYPLFSAGLGFSLMGIAYMLRWTVSWGNAVMGG